MESKLNTRNVMVELFEDEPAILTMKRQKFIKAKVLQLGSGVTKLLKDGDIVKCYNEGREIKQGSRKARIIHEEAIILIYHKN